MSEPVFMAQIRAADIPESMPVSRAIRDFMVAHPPTPEGQPKEELLQLLMLSVMRLEGRVVVLERRSGSRHRVSGSAGRDLPKTELVRRA